jgi:PKD repeat protein
MKKLVLMALMAFGFGAVAQNNLTVNVRDSANIAHQGVAVFYYSSPAAFFANGYQNPPTLQNFDAYIYSNNSGTASFGIGNLTAQDTIFWATKDCSGNVIWGTSVVNPSNPAINATLNLSCPPSDCEVLFNTLSYVTSSFTTYVIEAISLLEFSHTSLPSGISSAISINGVTTLGSTSSNYDSIFFNSSVYPRGVNFCYARVDSSCTVTCDSLGNVSRGVIGGPVACNADFFVDSLGANATGLPYVFRDNSTSNRTIISYDWDFGDSTFASSSTPVAQYHTYMAGGGSRGVCLTITSVFNGDTCVSTKCHGVLLGGHNPNPIHCNAYYRVDSLNSVLLPRQLVLQELSSSNGSIVDYSWDFGDGTIINAQYPSHNYNSAGVYNVCLTTTALDSSGVDTCVSTYCDSIGFNANGNIVYKGMTGFTIKVIDPATVGLEDKVLESSLSLFPNPATEKAQLTWDASLDVQSVAVYSISGQKLIDFQPTSNTAEISGLESGAYLVRVSSKKASKTLRLIIE